MGVDIEDLNFRKYSVVFGLGRLKRANGEIDEENVTRQRLWVHASLRGKPTQL